METNTNTTVTPDQRFTVNAMIKDLRHKGQHLDAMILDKASYWESYPQSYTAEQVHLAKVLMTTAYGTEHWNLIATAILIILENK